MESSEWVSQFDELEIWVMNTEYTLFGPDGPLVDPERVHWGRLDEMSKVLAVAPAGAAVRLFWSDAVVSVDGGDLSQWTWHTGKRAPSEQQLSRFLWPNIKAASRGDCRTRKVYEAKRDMDAQTAANNGCRSSASDEGTTPGVFVWRNSLDASQTDASSPTGTNSRHFLQVFTRRHKHLLGVLLDYDGTELRFLTSRPSADGIQPRAAVVILGGPKGMSQPIKEEVKSLFVATSVPLVVVSLGPCQEMAHACVAFLSLHEDAGRLKAALTDLHLLGPEAYVKLVEDVQACWLAGGRAKFAIWHRVGRWLRSRTGVKRRCCKVRRIDA